MMKNFNRNKSLEELDGEDWGKPPVPSHLVRTCYSLRKKPLREFTAEDLRIKIGQNESLEYLIPIAIEALQKNPFIDGDYYEGALLNAILSVKKEFWDENIQLYNSVEEILQKAESFGDDDSQEILTVLLPMTIYNFRKNNPQNY